MVWAFLSIFFLTALPVFSSLDLLVGVGISAFTETKEYYLCLPSRESLE